MLFTFQVRQAFTKLRQAFVDTATLNDFDSESHIRIETNVFGYVIGRIFSLLTLNNLAQWYLTAFFSQKKIPAETCYKTYVSELLAIIEAFKTWKHYFKGYIYEVFILTNYNNFKCFMDMKNLSNKQVC